MDPIRIGVIGLRFGQYHVRTLANMADARLVAIADRNPDLPGGLEVYARQYGATAYRDGIEMMEREQLDAVSLCVAPGGRAALIEHAARKSLPMFIEKPWASNLEHAHRLADICRQHHATVMVAFSFRFLPAIVRLRELMDGELGPGWMLNAEYVFSWLPPAASWLWDPQNGGGFINENSCHLFDAIRSLLGDPVSLSAEGAVFAGSPSEDAAAITLRFAGGAIAALTCGGIGSRAIREFPRLDIITTHGQAHLAGRDHIWERLTWTTRASDEIQTFDCPPETGDRTRYTYAMRHFFDCIRTGQQPSVTVEDGIQSVAIAMAVYESARTGKKVRLG
jgi:myo-inositol 2-dehydrogenase / D-chiro-inositol 1-dehydrogenase